MRLARVHEISRKTASAARSPWHHCRRMHRTPHHPEHVRRRSSRGSTIGIGSGDAGATAGRPELCGRRCPSASPMNRRRARRHGGFQLRTGGVFITGTHDMMGTDRLEVLTDAGKIVVEDSRVATVHRLKKPMQECSTTMNAAAIQRLVRQDPDWSQYRTAAHQRALPARDRPRCGVGVLRPRHSLRPASAGPCRRGPVLHLA